MSDVVEFEFLLFDEVTTSVVLVAVLFCEADVEFLFAESYSLVEFVDGGLVSDFSLETAAAFVEF